MDRYEHPVVDRLDTIFGSLILGAGVVAGVAAVAGAPAAVPLAAMAALWGWVDQKHEAMDLLRKLLDRSAHRLRKTPGAEHHDLVNAAHTVIVAAAFFDVLGEHLQQTGDHRRRLRAVERDELLAGRVIDDGTDFVNALRQAEIPAPSAACGFEENVGRIEDWFHDRLDTVALHRLDNVAQAGVVEAMTGRYRTYYLRLAGQVPEFLIWASLGEHAATRTEIEHVHHDLAAAMRRQGGALSRIERLMLLSATDHPNDLCARLHDANVAVLGEPVVPRDAAHLYGDLRFPSVDEGYVEPQYRVAPAGPSARPADDAWWQKRAVRDSVDLMLAAHLAAAAAFTRPLLVLGEPGVGKSLLTKILAARLPAATHTVVRVPLRRVNANARVFEQVQEALDELTNRRVDWPQLAEQTGARIRVVLLDGLDELLQATSLDRGDYLHRVVEFQEREAAQGSPVIVAVTSRTMVADRVDVPEGTTVVRIEEFDDSRIDAWLDVWRRTNLSAVRARRARDVSRDAIDAQRKLAGQPLLLMMLAVHLADPDSPEMTADLSTAGLYRRLLVGFARREVLKATSGSLDASALDRGVRDHVRRLAVAAFGMFNRGRQDIAETELANDLASLSVSARDAERSGRAVLGEFFFVHASQARGSAPGDVHRRYEFLHATFGEYLVAAEAVETLRRLARDADESYGDDVNDGRLRALLSHQPLSTRRATLTFAAEMIAEIPADERERLAVTLERLVRAVRQPRYPGNLDSYRPTPPDLLRAFAAYSANLVLLRLLLVPEPGRLPLPSLFDDDWHGQWRSMVTGWQAGLDAESLRTILMALTRKDDGIWLSEHLFFSSEAAYARLVADRNLETWLRYGMASDDGLHYWYPGDDWHVAMLACLRAAVAPGDASRNLLLLSPPPGAAAEEVRNVAAAASQLLKLRAHQMRGAVIDGVVAWYLTLPDVVGSDPAGLASAVAAHPELLNRFGILRDPATYGDAPSVLPILATAEHDHRGPLFDQLVHTLNVRRAREGIHENGATSAGALPDAYRLHSGGINNMFVDVAGAAVDHAARAVVEGLGTAAWAEVRDRTATFLARGDAECMGGHRKRLERTRDAIRLGSADVDDEVSQWRSRFQDVLHDHPERAREVAVLTHDLRGFSGEPAAREADRSLTPRPVLVMDGLMAS
ncbi:NACHT domain-containing protein [Dactylosporangium sp. CS-033363]|uniref:NACHT domain-containing protein n=1 Tax=Dactylosporangium sp. CS-033363 TaxID=3239935 RepID=UPI003D8ED032